jgi:butyryl-CoA dehydrogenase
MANPRLSDRDVAFQLHEVLDATDLLRWPAFADHDASSFEGYLGACRRFARETLWPSYRAIDAEPPHLAAGRVLAHPRLRELWPRLRALGVIAATRPAAVGGQQLPLTIAVAAQVYLMAGNLAAFAYAGLTTGAAHLIEAFGSAELQARYLAPLYEGRWTGTMALTEPHAGSSLADLTTTAEPAADGDGHLVRGAKIFISGGDHDLVDNIVHLVLARIAGAPSGTRGISLFVVPARRPGRGGELVGNDVRVAGVIHKIGWRGIPSLALAFGDEGDCRGWLVGEPGRGLAYMFQMMNEARIMVGANSVATAAVAYHEAVAYARERPQGRPLEAREAEQPQVPIIEHADVRRMLLRQKAIVEGGLALVLRAARLADAAEHAPDDAARARARRILELMTPIAKTFPAERGFEANALALQVHGGYGYSSESVVEALLRDQKLNTIHEGTTGIQGLDLLGRKVMAEGGRALRELAEEVEAACVRAADAGLDASWVAAVREATRTTCALTESLGARGLGGDARGMLLHSADYLELCGIWVVGWLWLEQATAAARGGLAASAEDRAFYAGKRAAAQYWIRTELPRVAHLAALCRDGEDSYGAMAPAWFP